MIRVASIICGVFAVLGLLALIGLIWLRFPDNHGGGPIAFRWFFAGLLFLFWCFRFFASRAPSFFIACALIGLISTLVVNHRNIMVDYDEWIRRGMPEWGQARKVGYLQTPSATLREKGSSETGETR